MWSGLRGRALKSELVHKCKIESDRLPPHSSKLAMWTWVFQLPLSLGSHVSEDWHQSFALLTFYGSRNAQVRPCENNFKNQRWGVGGDGRKETRNYCESESGILPTKSCTSYCLQESVPGARSGSKVSGEAGRSLLWRYPTSWRWAKGGYSVPFRVGARGATCVRQGRQTPTCPMTIDLGCWSIQCCWLETLGIFEKAPL